MAEAALPDASLSSSSLRDIRDGVDVVAEAFQVVRRPLVVLKLEDELSARSDCLADYVQEDDPTLILECGEWWTSR